MRRLKGLHKLTPEEVENILMDELMDGAGTLTDLCNETGIPTRYAKMLLEDLVKRGLVTSRIVPSPYDNPMIGEIVHYDMARTGGGR